MANFFDMAQGMMDGILNPHLAAQQPFQQMYKCFSVAHAPESLHSLEGGDKICMPPSALEQLAQRHVQYPMMFEVSNPQNPEKKIHVGVMEFSAREGTCFIPYWVMKNVDLEDGSLVTLKNIQLPKGRFIQLQPHLTRFTELSDPHAVLERQLRQYSCMTKGTTIAIQHGGDTYYLDITKVEPVDAVSIIETDVEVDFAPPKDMQEEGPKPIASRSSASANFDWDSISANDTPETSKALNDSASKESSGNYFSQLGQGHRLSAKPVSFEEVKSSSDNSKPTTPNSTTKIVEENDGFRFIYEVDQKTGQKRLVRRVRIPNSSYFSGQGHRLSGQS
eukprot:108928_1